MKSAIRKLGGLILGLILLCGAAVSTSAGTRLWQRHYRVYYTPVHHYYPHRYVYYHPRRYVYYHPGGYYVTWHRHHRYWWHHRDWN